MPARASKCRSPLKILLTNEEITSQQSLEELLAGTKGSASNCNEPQPLIADSTNENDNFPPAKMDPLDTEEGQHSLVVEQKIRALVAPVIVAQHEAQCIAREVAAARTACDLVRVLECPASIPKLPTTDEGIHNLKPSCWSTP